MFLIFCTLRHWKWSSSGFVHVLWWNHTKLLQSPVLSGSKERKLGHLIWAGPKSGGVWHKVVCSVGPHHHHHHPLRDRQEGLFAVSRGKSSGWGLGWLQTTTRTCQSSCQCKGGPRRQHRKHGCKIAGAFLNMLLDYRWTVCDIFYCMIKGVRGSYWSVCIFVELVRTQFIFLFLFL